MQVSDANFFLISEINNNDKEMMIWNINLSLPSLNLVEYRTKEFLMQLTGVIIN